MNLANIIEGHEASRPAYIDGDTTLTYGELRTRTASIRKLLDDRGIGAGDVVAVPCGNEPLFVVAVLGVVGVGARAVPMRPNNPVPELHRKLDSIEPALLLVGEEAAWMLDHGDDVEAPMVDLRSVPTEAANAPPPVDCAPEDIAVMMLTSGVSGHAKVAMLSHRNLLWAQEAVSERSVDGLNADDRLLAVLPFSHIYGMNVVLFAGLRLGALVVGQRRFDVDGSIELVRRHQITILGGAPPMWRRWAQADLPADSFDSVRRAVSGAAALPEATFVAMRDRHGVVLEEGYGMTETASVLTTSRGHEIRQGAVGKPVDGLELVLVEADGTPVDPGDSGEVVVRGPGIFSGYYNDDEATHAVITDDGWFWTGDIGVFDDDGYLHLVDRVKDIIIVNGFNVYPAEVEAVLREHPAVEGAVVVGVPDDETGEAVIAHVTASVDGGELLAFARERLSRYKCPSDIVFTDELPVAPTGKLIRRELR